MRGEYHIIPILFRPFDVKYSVLTNKSSGFLGRPRYSTMIQMCFDFQNYALLVGRQNKSDTIDSFLVTDLASEMKCAERTIQSYHMPLFIAETDMIHNTIRPKANFATVFKAIESRKEEKVIITHYRFKPKVFVDSNIMRGSTHYIFVMGYFFVNSLLFIFE